MAIIESAGIKDTKLIKNLNYSLSSADNYMKGLACEIIFSYISDLSPLPLPIERFSSSFIAKDSSNKEIKSFATLKSVHGNFRKILFKRFLFSDFKPDYSKQLIDYVVSKYGARGADTFILFVPEDTDFIDFIFSLFIQECGFRNCSKKITYCVDCKTIKDKSGDLENLKLEIFDIKDSGVITDLYNMLLLPHFRYSLEKEPTEFLMGFFEKDIRQFVIKDGNKIIAFISCNLVEGSIYPIICEGYSERFFDIVGAVLKNFSYNFKKVKIYISHYLANGERFEKYMKDLEGERLKSNILLVKDFYKPIKNSIMDVAENILMDVAGNKVTENKFFAK